MVTAWCLSQLLSVQGLNGGGEVTRLPSPREDWRKSCSQKMSTTENREVVRSWEIRRGDWWGES
jgi:hypothetical protein